jgi:hypothetical protein
VRCRSLMNDFFSDERYQPRKSAVSMPTVADLRTRRRNARSSFFPLPHIARTSAWRASFDLSQRNARKLSPSSKRDETSPLRSVELHHAARTLSRKASTSIFSRSACFDSSLAELSTCVDAAPTSPEACVTPTIFEETSLVPAAA